MSSGYIPDANLMKARTIAFRLRKLMEKYFLEPPQDDRHAEMQALRAEIEKLGFTMSWKVGVVINEENGTYRASATIRLLKRKDPML